MAVQHAVNYCDQREHGIAVAAQALDKIGLSGAVKSANVKPPYRGVIAFKFRSEFQ
ncbi:MAG: hypothetical protein AB7O43_21240 [Hyphomicrobiaceae bacterium]